MSKDLKQENHELLQKLRLAESMELAYQDEIEHLKETLQAAQTSTNSGDPVRYESYQKELTQLHERLEQADEQVHTLLEKLEESERHRAVLEERLNSAELLLEKSVSEPSLCSSVNSSHPDPKVLMDTVAQLKEDLSKNEASARTTQSKLERQLMEAEEDRGYLQNHIAELERHLCEARGELSDVRAQMEALELQTNTTEKTRGNSVFGEVEDRRIRAEKLVLQQRGEIEELRLSIKKIEAASNHKLMETVRKLEVRYRDRDTKFVDELVAERARLMTENNQLTRRIQQMEELQLDNERNAVKMSKAFNLEGNCQENLIKSLEHRVSVLQRSLTKQSSAADGLRERLLNASLLRRQMQTELWQQIDTATRLSERNKELRKQLEQRENATKSNEVAKTPTHSAGCPETETTSKLLSGELAETNSMGKENAPLKTDEIDEHHLDEARPSRILRSTTHTEVQELELPPSCKTS
ncbi:Tropomyosin [Fasciola gigantica]|uniref:Tropomyosin n=1 Tax=Fasciola gigantica TaxID=46835 RepID=A0A504YZ74_FASGI|nr:Tropomyosin [Fasciola gigantica]